MWLSTNARRTPAFGMVNRVCSPRSRLHGAISSASLRPVSAPRAAATLASNIARTAARVAGGW
jgi:hypothetical protein